MNGKDLLKGFSHIEEGILHDADGQKTNIKSRKYLIPIAAVIAAAFAVTIAIPYFFTSSTPVAPIPSINHGADAPMGMRKTLNYEGFRYSFLENGSIYDISADNIGEKLGVLEYSIKENPEVYGKMDLSASFAIGGTIYQINSYDPSFRVAVEFDGNYYIAQRVGSVSGEDILLPDYFETADFISNVENISVCDHLGNTVLQEISKKNDIKAMISLLSQSEPATLSNEQYEQIAKAQSIGKSFMLIFELSDTTEFKLYVIPSLSVAMVGDNRYTLSNEWKQEYSDFFEGLETTQAIPQQ
ncbi:MAG: hypothetical protein RSC41_00570 [Oscillospiraceae bacterium]